MFLIKTFKRNNNSKIQIGIEEASYCIANHFTNFFIIASLNFLSNLKNKLFNCNMEFNENSLEMHLTDKQKLFDIVKNFQNKYSCGYYEITMNLKKYVLAENKDLICHIINNSLNFGVSKWSEINLCDPYSQKGDDSNVKNYNPISLVPSFPKLFEHVISNRFIRFFVQIKHPK